MTVRITLATAASMMKQVSTVLCIDDLRANRILLKRLFTRHGYEVVDCADADGALRAAAEAPPAVIVLDLFLPRPIDGFEALRKLKSHPRVGMLPVLVVSSHADPKMCDEAIRWVRSNAYSAPPTTGCWRQLRHLCPGRAKRNDRGDQRRCAAELARRHRTAVSVLKRTRHVSSDDVEKMIGFDGIEEVCAPAGLLAFLKLVLILRVSTDEDNWNASGASICFEPAAELETVDVGQDDIEDDHIRLELGQAKSFAAVEGGQDRRVRLLKNTHMGVTMAGVVVNGENRFAL